MPAKEWNLWKELEISLVLMSMLVLGVLDREKMMRNLYRLSAALTRPPQGVTGWRERWGGRGAGRSLRVAFDSPAGALRG
jgi:hypothetical protein